MFDGRVGLTHPVACGPSTAFTVKTKFRSRRTPQAPLVLLIVTDRRCSTRPCYM